MMRCTNKRVILWPLAFLFLLASCNGAILPLSEQECQANTSRLMPSNRVPPETRTRRGSTLANETEGIHFSTIISELAIGEILAHYNNQTAGQRDDWSLVQSGRRCLHSLE